METNKGPIPEVSLPTPAADQPPIVDQRAESTLSPTFSSWVAARIATQNFFADDVSIADQQWRRWKGLD